MIDKIKHIAKTKIFKNSIWLTILQIMNTVIPMITIPYITRVLGADKYGEFSVALNWILYFQVLVEFGFGLNGARKAAIIKEHDKLQELFNNIISARIILLIISFILLNIIALISGFALSTYISMICLFVMIVGTTFQLTWLFQGKEDMKFITIINVISRIVSILLTFIFIKEPNDMYVYSLLYSITLLLSSVISIVVAKRKYGLHFKFAKVKKIKQEVQEGKYLFFSSAMSKVFSNIGITVLGIVAENNIVGIYSAISKIPYVLTMFFTAVAQAIYPYNSIKFKESMNKGIKQLKKLAIPIFIVFLIPIVIIMLFNKTIINILFGEEYVTYSIIVIPLVIQFIFAMINNFLGIQFLVASDNQKNYSKAFTVGCIIIVISNIVLGNVLKIYGVAIAAVIGEISLTLAYLYQIKRLLKQRSKE